MEEIIIRKKDLENLGRKLMKEVYKFLHDDYILTFEEMKVEKDKIEKYLVKFYLEMIYEINHFIPIEKSKYENIFLNESEKYLKEIEDKIENESLDINLIYEVLNRIELSLDINLIYEVLNRIELEFEIDEDSFCKKKAFSYIYLVFDHYYKYLED